MWGGEDPIDCERQGLENVCMSEWKNTFGSIIGQRIVINEANVLDYVRIVEKLGNSVIEFISSSKSVLLEGYNE